MFNVILKTLYFFVEKTTRNGFAFRKRARECY